MLRLDGHVAIVTGAGRGRGRAYAIELARRGAAVVVNDLGTDVDGVGVSDSPARSTAEEIRTNGGIAYPDTSDISDFVQVRSLIEGAISELGRLDIIVNNAGISPFNLFGEIDEESWRRMFGVHVDGTFNLTRAAWPHMCARHHGRVVNTISTAIFGVEGTAHYAAAKGAILGLTKALALEGSAFNINVNAVAPSGALSRMMRARLAYMQGKDGHNAAGPDWVSETLSQVVAWLSHDSCTLSGEILHVKHRHISRIFLAESGGREMSAEATEMLEAHREEILSTDGWRIPRDGTEASWAAHGAQEQLAGVGIDFGDSLARLRGEALSDDTAEGSSQH
jgi:NAD(P)-dependent dehydrogenase (short-subunit alcohol dehydrogenase family)